MTLMDVGRRALQDELPSSGEFWNKIASDFGQNVAWDVIGWGIAKGTKTRAQVMGEPILDGKQTRDGGYQLRQIDELFRAHGMTTRLVVVDDGKTDAEIRADLMENLKRAGDYVVVNYRREDVGQRGGPHHSPLAAYDQESDSVLVMDVNPANAAWVWMPVPTLVKGMRTFDQAENRGYVLVQSR